MTTLSIGLILFLGMHSVAIVASDWRDRMAAQLGLGWRAIYALISLLGLVLIVRGYVAARLTPEILYLPPTWARHVTMTLMLPVFPLLLATYLPGRIKATLQHPMLVATKLWAVAHLLSNGMQADVLLFGSFLLWAVADRISLKRRPVRALKPMLNSTYNDWIAVTAGLLLYGLFITWAHAKLIGVSVM